MIVTIIIVYITLVALGLGLNIFFFPTAYMKYRYIFAPWIATSFIIFIGISLSSSRIAMEHSLLSNVTLKGYQFIILFGFFILISASFLKWKYIFTKKVNLYLIAGFLLLIFLLSKFSVKSVDKELVNWSSFYSKETIIDFLGKTQNPTLLNKNIGEPILVAFWRAVLDKDYLHTIENMKAIYFGFLLAPVYVLFEWAKKFNKKIRFFPIAFIFILMLLFRNIFFNLNVILSGGLLLSGICISIFLTKPVKNTIHGLSVLLGGILFSLFTINSLAFVMLASFLGIVIFFTNSKEKKYLFYNYLIAFFIMFIMNPLVVGLSLFHP